MYTHDIAWECPREPFSEPIRWGGGGQKAHVADTLTWAPPPRGSGPPGSPQAVTVAPPPSTPPSSTPSPPPPLPPSPRYDVPGQTSNYLNGSQDDKQRGLGRLPAQARAHQSSLVSSLVEEKRQFQGTWGTMTV